VDEVLGGFSHLAIVAVIHLHGSTFRVFDLDTLSPQLWLALCSRDKLTVSDRHFDVDLVGWGAGWVRLRLCILAVDHLCGEVDLYLHQLTILPRHRRALFISSPDLLSIDDFPVGLTVMLSDILADGDLFDVRDRDGTFFALLDIHGGGGDASSSSGPQLRRYGAVWSCERLADNVGDIQAELLPLLFTDWHVAGGTAFLI